MDLHTLLDRSRASDAFKADVQLYSSEGSADRIHAIRHAPRLKVLRVLAQLLSAHPDLPVERVRIDATSGCADFTGTVTVHSAHGPRRFEFAWDCYWRAQQEGWTDHFGFPDQVRAAREFGWQCFRTWREIPIQAGASDPAVPILS